MTVRTLLATIDSHELTEWEAFIKLENEAKEKKPENVNDQIKQAFRVA